MYDIIDAKRSVRKIYTESLIGRGDISVEEAEHALKDFSNQLEHVFNEVRELETHPAALSPSVEEEQPVPTDLDTSVPLEVVHRIGDAHVELPEGFTVHPRVKPVLRAAAQDVPRGRHRLGVRASCSRSGSLAMEGKLVRLSGQDSRRGTFVQRHSVVIDRKTGDEYSRCATCRPSRSGSCPTTRRCRSSPRSASSTATRWPTRTRWCCGRRSSATSSTAPSRSSTSSSPPARPSGASAPTSCCCCRTASRARARTTPPGRIERFLQLCAEGSMTVARAVEPANYFHLLRRHALDGVHRPLVVFTPEVDAAQPGRGQPAVRLHRRPVPLGDRRPALPRERRPRRRRPPRPAVQRQDLLRAGRRPRQARASTTPRSCGSSSSTRCRDRQLAAVLERYPNAEDVRWVQEEPANQGAWPLLRARRCRRSCPSGWSGIKRISRRRMAAPRRARRRCTRSSRPTLDRRRPFA